MQDLLPFPEQNVLFPVLDFCVLGFLSPRCKEKTPIGLSSAWYLLAQNPGPAPAAVSGGWRLTVPPALQVGCAQVGSQAGAGAAEGRRVR